MKIGYSNEKVQKLCENEKEAKRKIGNIASKSLFKKLNWLDGAPNLDFFNTVYKSLRLHKLKGNYDGMYALEITDQYRLVFYPCNDNGEPDYESDFKFISVVTIEEVSKHYE